MRRYNKFEKKKTIVWICLLFALGLGIGYAILSEKLSVNGTLNYGSMVWDVGFSSATDGGGTITSSPTLSNDKKTITVSCNIGTSTKSETCIAKATIKNASSFGVELESNPTITFDNTYISSVTAVWTGSNTNVVAGNSLEQNTEEEIMITITTKELTKDMLPESTLSVPITIIMDWAEKEPDNSIKSFTATSPLYKELQKFKHWEENGKVVSTEPNYVYYGTQEKNLIPVYGDFIEVQPINNATANNWNEETLTFSINTEQDGWYEVGYVTEKLQKGMYIEFEIDYGTHILYGISPSSYFENPLEHGWAPSYEKIFVAKYNIYAVKNEGTLWLHENATSATDKTQFVSPSINIKNLMTSNEKIKIKYVLDDELLMYVNGVLFTASNKENWTIDENETYNLSFSGNQTAFTITDFGYDEYLTNKGNFGTPTSSPVSKESFNGKKITFLGDSITAGVGASSSENRYTTVLANSLGMVENNMGASGTVLATGGHRSSRINDINSIPLDSDYVTILLGINDFDQCKNNDTSQYYCLGDFNSTDTSTIYGALHVYSQNLIKRFREQDTKIIFMTPVITSWNNSVGGQDWDQSKTNACGYSLPDLVNAIKEVTSYYGIVTLDLNQLSGLQSTDFGDGIHPNDSGMKKIADTIEEFILKNYSY